MLFLLLKFFTRKKNTTRNHVVFLYFLLYYCLGKDPVKYLNLVNILILIVK